MILHIQGHGTLRVNLHSGIPPSAAQVQTFYDVHLPSQLGAGKVEDLRYVWNDERLFAVRRLDSMDSVWIHLAQDVLGVWELQSDEDLLLIPTLPGFILFPAEFRGNIGYITRQRITSAKMQTEGGRLGMSCLHAPCHP